MTFAEFAQVFIDREQKRLRSCPLAGILHDRLQSAQPFPLQSQHKPDSLARMTRARALYAEERRDAGNQARALDPPPAPPIPPNQAPGVFNTLPFHKNVR